MKRIQRKRTKGWHMPENTVYVGRPTKWGNPFKLSEYKIEDSLWKVKTWLAFALSTSLAMLTF